jgi:predicted O-methyltransferase YrrM
MKSVPQRYNKMLPLIEEVQPKTILEIGTWSGDRATQLIQHALKFQPSVHYIGYDLFEDASPETDAEELNVKKHFSVEQVEKKLERFRQRIEKSYMGKRSFTWELVKGNTRETLKHQTVDFAYIDGGHSVKTIESDYEAVKNSKVVVFDDYYLRDEEGYIPDTSKYGANQIVDKIGAGVYVETSDRVNGGGYVTLAVYPAR